MIFTIRGIALEPHAETLGMSGVEKQWPEDEIKNASDTLVGQPVTASSSQTVDNVIGEVVEATYDEEEGLVYEAEINDEEVAQKLQEGLGDLAPRMFHEAIGTAEVDESQEPAVVTDLEFDALFMCPETADGVPGVIDVTERNDE